MQNVLLNDETDPREKRYSSSEPEHQQATTTKRVTTTATNDEVGNSSWVLLHSIAANYPEKPTSEKKDEVLRFINSLAEVYPAAYCKEDQEKCHNLFKQNPPNLNSKKDFALWMCELHNGVNRRLGKKQFDCARVDVRWKPDKSHDS